MLCVFCHVLTNNLYVQIWSITVLGSVLFTDIFRATSKYLTRSHCSLYTLNGNDESFYTHIRAHITLYITFHSRSSSYSEIFTFPWHSQSPDTDVRYDPLWPMECRRYDESRNLECACPFRNSILFSMRMYSS